MTCIILLYGLSREYHTIDSLWFALVNAMFKLLHKCLRSCAGIWGRFHRLLKQWSTSGTYPGAAAGMLKNDSIFSA